MTEQTSSPATSRDSDEEPVVFRVSTKRLVAKDVTTVVVGLLVFFGLLGLVRYGVPRWLQGYEPPVDLAVEIAVPGFTMVLGVAVTAIRTSRMVRRHGEKVQDTVLTSDGVYVPPAKPDGPRVLVPWSMVSGIAVRRSLLWCYICLHTSDDQVVTLDLAAHRRGDPRLAEALRALREYARRHGADTDGPVGPLLSVAGRGVLTGVVAFGVLGYACVATLPVVPPWAPHAVRIPDACEALIAAGLDQYWPAEQRETPQATQESWSLSESRTCKVERRRDADDDAGWQRITLAIERYDGYALTVGAKEAYEAVSIVESYDGLSMVRRLSVGDIGFLYRFRSSGGSVYVAVSRGDVVVRVDAESEGDAARRDAVAIQLAEGVLRQIEFA